MSIIELKNLIASKLGIDISIICAEQFNVRFHYHGNTYRVTTDLSVEKVDGTIDSDTRQLEKLLRGEQWDGTGLPPVGTECEYKWQNDKWRSGKVCYLSKHTVLMMEIFEGEESESCYGSDDVQFRPLRTERDKAIEQMAIYVNNTAAENLYDAIVAGKIDGLGKVG